MNVLKLLFQIPPPPSWGEEIEYSQSDYEEFDEFQARLDRRLDGHDDGSGPREILLPPLSIDNFKGLLDISEMLTLLDFSWQENEDYGMGRHVHYRPMSDDTYEEYYNFLADRMFKTKNNIAILSLMPFLTPNTRIIDDKIIHVKFRESLTQWSYYTDHPSDRHYAYISINRGEHSPKPTTIEFRHNEAHPLEAYAFIYLLHYLLNTNTTFKIDVIGNYDNSNTIKIDNHQITDVSWDILEIPIDTFKYVIKKIMEKIPNDPKNNKAKYHVWQVYQNIIKGNRIWENDFIYKYYGNYKYDNKIKDLVEDIINNNVSARIKITDVKIEQDLTVLYATSIIIESPKTKRVIEVKNPFYLNDYVRVEPTKSKKSTKTINVTL